jgi:NAD+ synthase
MQAEKQIVRFLRKKVKEAKANGVVIGLSGGVDSSLIAALCVKALGKEKVLGLVMPEKETRNEKNIQDARRIANLLGITYYEVDFTEVYNAFKKIIPIFDESLIPAGNLRARIRMCILYYFSNKLNLLVAGTGDKSELSICYFTKYGDGGVDFLPIGDLYKSEVRKFALKMGVPEDIVNKPSSPNLWVGQTARDEIGVDYEKLDEILIGLEKDSPKKVAKETNVSLNRVIEIIRMGERGKHKLTPPPIAKLKKVKL